jgi:hypothetical protein
VDSNSPLFDVLLKTVDRLLIAQGANPEIMPEEDKLFIVIECIEVDAANLPNPPTPQEDLRDPVSYPEPV